MSTSTPGASFGPAATRGPDGLAVIGRTLHDLRGIRFGDGDGGAAPAGDPAPAPAAPAAPAEPAAPAAWDGKIESLDPGIQKIITDLRKEAGDHRVAARSAADTAKLELTNQLAVALGIKTDDAKDPDKLAASLTEAQATAKQSAIQLAVYKAAGAHQGNPDALLDSNTFLAKVSDLDPTAADFGEQVSEAIKAAVTANPTLKAARAAGASTVDTPGGTGEQGQITEEQLARMTPQEINDALEKGLLKNLL